MMSSKTDKTLKYTPNKYRLTEHGDESLKGKTERSTLLTYTVFRGGLEHLKIETRLINERFESVMGECVIVTLKVHRLYSK
jgi:hypothetical protein